MSKRRRKQPHAIWLLQTNVVQLQVMKDTLQSMMRSSKANGWTRKIKKTSSIFVSLSRMGMNVWECRFHCHSTIHQQPWKFRSPLKPRYTQLQIHNPHRRHSLLQHHQECHLVWIHPWPHFRLWSSCTFKRMSPRMLHIGFTPVLQDTHKPKWEPPSSMFKWQHSQCQGFINSVV
jgi:hypothetical protein